MSDILKPKNVIVGFIEKDDDINDELKTIVNGVPKTCRGFVSKIDSRPHILCNISRFKSTSESEQYKLIHHEFAGLASIENNEGAASDYAISAQITDYLTQQTVLRLAIKPKAINNLCEFNIASDSKPLPIDSWKRGDCEESGADLKAMIKCSRKIENPITDKCEITVRTENPGRNTCYVVHWSTATLFKIQIQSPEQQRDKACSLVAKCLQKIASSNDPDQYELDIKKSQIISKAYNCNL